jgi:hypothetical protein
MNGYEDVHRSARLAIPTAVEMETLYPATDHFITHYGFDSKPKAWNTVSYFGERYELAMQVEVSIDYKAKTVTQIGEPIFSLLEIERIVPLGGGAFSESVAKDVHISLDDWKTLYRNKGDLSSIGIMKNATPVQYFRESMASERSNRISISLLGDDETTRDDHGSR